MRKNKNKKHKKLSKTNKNRIRKNSKSYREQRTITKRTHQPLYSAAEAAAAYYDEKPNKRDFRYSICRKSEKDPMRSYNFITDHLKANTRRDAYVKARKIALTKKDMDGFCGMTVHDYNGDNSIVYYTKEHILRIAA